MYRYQTSWSKSRRRYTEDLRRTSKLSGGDASQIQGGCF